MDLEVLPSVVFDDEVYDRDAMFVEGSSGVEL